MSRHPQSQMVESGPAESACVDPWPLRRATLVIAAGVYAPSLRCREHMVPVAEAIGRHVAYSTR